MINAPIWLTKVANWFLFVKYLFVWLSKNVKNCSSLIMAHQWLSKRCLNTKPWNRSDKLYLDWFTKREAFIGKAVQTSTFLQEKIAKTAIERPDLPCIKSHEKNYSYSEINDWANQRALFFRSSSCHFQN